MTSITFRFCKTNPQNCVCSQSPFHSLTARSVVPQSVAVELSVNATTRLSERIARKMRVCLTGVTFDEGGAVKILFRLSHDLHSRFPDSPRYKDARLEPHCSQPSLSFAPAPLSPHSPSPISRFQHGSEPHPYRQRKFLLRLATCPTLS